MTEALLHPLILKVSRSPFFDQNARPSFDVSMIKRSSGVTLDIEHHANAKFRKRKEVKKRRVKKEI